MLSIEPRAARTAWSYAAVLLTLWSLFIVRKTILLFLLSVMFAYLLYPMVEMCQRRLRMKARLGAVAIPFAAILLLFVVAGFLLRGPVHEESRNLEQEIASAEFRNNLANWHVLGIPIGEKLIEGRGRAQVQAQLKNRLMQMTPEVGRGINRVLRDIGNIFIIPILGFFILLDGRRIRDTLVDLFFSPAAGKEMGNVKHIVDCVLEDAHTLILQYMRALVLLCFSVLVVFSIALKLMGVRYALLLALLAFPLEFIPLIGPLVAGLIIIAVCEFNQFPHLPWVIGFLIVYRLFQDYMLSPLLMRKSVQLHPLLVIFGIFAGGEIGGIGAIFLSVPLLAIARLIIYEYRSHACSDHLNRATGVTVSPALDETAASGVTWGPVGSQS